MRCGPIRQLLTISLALPGLLALLSLPAYALSVDTQEEAILLTETGDAGQLLDTAYRTGNPQVEGQPIIGISGNLSLGSDTTPVDLIDLYQIEINSGTFSAYSSSEGPVIIVTPPTPRGSSQPVSGTGFGPALYLFNAQGNGLLANANTTTNPVLEASGLAPGTYYLAVSYAPAPLDAAMQSIFPAFLGSGQVGPNSGTGPLANWSPVAISTVGLPDPNQTTPYFINLSGASIAPEPAIGGGLAISALLLALQGYRRQKARS
ncbi:hypothetical protein [Gloeobacter kilaueensis]|uniref:PEP-CTERM protein-sorting domain-containing protein n=1 Tax=Gloeobacter kilaueensis (strain ATCC BAA-2537 / CCAP 1431/1 / ULC 316 / JS1) TaxID=1183438 RepID=U5QQI6_GLOK1|nr:hypothetical protein [Gloeobacter kilaueensis]AGY59945.1 hypothetical protein GKIL_3699 [Gloeobacter kilaueensis JS1]